MADPSGVAWACLSVALAALDASDVRYGSLTWNTAHQTAARALARAERAFSDLDAPPRSRRRRVLAEALDKARVCVTYFEEGDLVELDRYAGLAERAARRALALETGKIDPASSVHLD